MKIENICFKTGFASLSPLRLKDIKNSYEKNSEYSSFLKWFSGFTDAEGNFLISLDRGYIRFRFKILMHIDNLKALNTIKSILNVGNVTTEENRNRCSFVVQDFIEIRDVICAIFLEYPLLTSKKLDFEDFHKAILIKNKNSLSNEDKEKIFSLKNGMNSKREQFTFYVTSQIKISSEWFIGFFEGEGTFGIKTGSSMYFQVAQKNTSIDSLNAIIAFLTTLKSPILPKGINILPVNVVNTLNTKTDVVSLVVSSVDALYYYILPLLDASRMYTFKEMDFRLWRIALMLKIMGYYYLPEGKKLFLDISDVLNKRYSTGSIKDLDSILAEIFARYETILLIDSPFNVKDNISHVDNVRKFRAKNRSNAPKTIYIYVAAPEDKLIKGSPFNSYSDAHKALGLKSTSNTCNRYLDTNRVYKKKYIFTSKPLLK